MKLEFESSTNTLPFIGNGYADEKFELGAAKVSQMLEAGIKAAQAGDRSEARQLLIQVTEAEPQNETAWLWMASISEYPEELIIFLNNVLSINAENARALEWMQATKTLLAKTFVKRGNDAADDANTDFARQCFLQAIVHDPESETAWLRLAETSDSADEKIAHLQKVLNINPENETAKSLLQTAKAQAAESILRKANSAAVAGERESAREMLREVFKHAPELEAAWILKSYLADSFSEKITCFEKVLSLNPENEMAISGLASLREMMAKTEARKAEQSAMLAAIEKTSAEEILVVSENQIVYAEEDDENSPTQELEYPPVFASAEYANKIYEDEEINYSHQSAEVSDFNFTKQENDYSNHEQAVFPQSLIEEDFAVETISAAANFMNTIPSNPTTEPHGAIQDEIIRAGEDFQIDPFADTYSDTPKEFTPLASENFGAENLPKSAAEPTACPFCNTENEPNAFVCQLCRTILTLSDLEMLLAHTEADREILRGAIEQMEAEKNSRQFSADEMKTLGIGHINLKNLRQGVTYLQKASLLNQNDVMLGSKVNFLKIRLSEIEQQENNASTTSKGRILVVDDSATVRKLISSKLEKSGHEVVSAVDGVDALEKIKEFVPDLILLDIMMPQLDGYQVCKLIRTNELTKDVPVVMISGKDGFFDKVRGRMAGTTGYITKPFGPETLMKTVETYIVQRGSMMNDEAGE